MGGIIGSMLILSESCKSLSQNLFSSVSTSSSAILLDFPFFLGELGRQDCRSLRSTGVVFRCSLHRSDLCIPAFFNFFFNFFRSLSRCWARSVLSDPDLAPRSSVESAIEDLGALDEAPCQAVTKITAAIASLNDRILFSQHSEMTGT